MNNILQNIHYDYGQIMVCDDMNFGEFPWSSVHYAQGFIRDKSEVSFRTLYQFGSADLVIALHSYEPDIQYLRVITVPFYAPTGKIYIGGAVYILDSPAIVQLEPGHYAVTAAQTPLVTEDVDDFAIPNERIILYFEKVEDPLNHSQVILADEAMNPPNVLLEGYESTS